MRVTIEIDEDTVVVERKGTSIYEIQTCLKRALLGIGVSHELVQDMFKNMV